MDLTKTIFPPVTAAVAAAAAAAAVALAACGAEAPAGRPNVFLVSIDTLRSDHLGCYGYERDTSPRLDRLALEGARVEQMISSTSWTLPAHAALFTGLSDSVHGCTDTDRPLSASRTTLAERFADAGYTTAGFFSGPYLHPVFGLGQGFETYVDCTSYADVNAELAREGQTFEGPDVWRRANDDVTNPRITARVEAWLADRPPEPFFLFVHLWDVHFDFVPPAPYDTLFDPDYTGPFDGSNFFFDERIAPGMNPRDLQHLIALYDGEIAWTDKHVGMLLDRLAAEGFEENTLVAVTADHGTAFFEHGQKAHRNGLYEELVRIPWILRWPAGIPAGNELQVQASLIDVTPTILELAGLPLPADVMGRSLAAELRGDAPPGADSTAVSELFTAGKELRSYRLPASKVIVDVPTQRALAFDLQADPAERRPLQGGSKMQEAVAGGQAAQRWLEDWKRNLPLAEQGSAVPEEVQRELERLGYVEVEGGPPAEGEER